MQSSNVAPVLVATVVGVVLFSGVISCSMASFAAGPVGQPATKTQQTAQTRPAPIAKKVNYRNFEVTGEVVDTWCYASKAVLDGRGPEHYKCADACAHGGVTLGIVDDQGNLYIAAKAKAYTGCQHLLEPFVAKRVHVKGWLSQAGGCNIMKIGQIELAHDKPQPKLPGEK